MTGIIQAILQILAALPAALSAIISILNAIKGSPKTVRIEAVQKGVAAIQAHIDNAKI